MLKIELNYEEGKSFVVSLYINDKYIKSFSNTCKGKLQKSLELNLQNARKYIKENFKNVKLERISCTNYGHDLEIYSAEY